jgi:tRNA-splicing ligase RtcB
LTTGLTRDDLLGNKEVLAEALFTIIPAGVGSTGAILLNESEMDAMLGGGARWAVKQGYGRTEDLGFIEEQGCMAGAVPAAVSDKAKRRQCDEMGTLGSGNHYLEVQEVVELFDREAADAFGLSKGDILVSIHCGSRGLGHQIGTEFLVEMAQEAHQYGIVLPDRELACAPIRSALGEKYLGAMRAGINCALANRQILTHLARRAFEYIVPKADLRLIYDVSHNTCKEEVHSIDGKPMPLFVHRKGATRALGPGHPDLPQSYQAIGQPVLIGGSMGTASYILAGMEEGEQRAFASACHGAGRAMSRRKATKQWRGRQVIDELASRGILIRSQSYRGVAEEAPGAYKDVDAVVDSAEQAGLARKVAKLAPVICVKG